MRDIEKEKTFNNDFNKIVYRAVSAHDLAVMANKEIKDKLPHNKIFQTKTNSKFSDCARGMDECGSFVRSKDFVMNNIEHLKPRTLKKIFGIGKKSKSKIMGIRKRPVKTIPVNEYDEAVIVKLLTRGVIPEKILELFPQYTNRQILRIKHGFRKYRTENCPTKTMDMLLDIQKNRHQWF